MKDKNALQDFVAAYGQMNRWSEIKAGGEILSSGPTIILSQFPWTKSFRPVVLRHGGR